LRFSKSQELKIAFKSEETSLSVSLAKQRKDNPQGVRI
jgi:hypothetical protein